MQSKFALLVVGGGGDGAKSEDNKKHGILPKE